MTNFRRLIPAAALALMFSTVAVAKPTPAAEAASAKTAAASVTKVGIINIQAAIVNSNEGQRDFEALQKKFDPKRQELEKLNQELEDLNKKLSTQGDKLSEEARNELVKEIDAKKKVLQRNYEDANSDIQAQQNEIANRIGSKMIQVLDKYAKDNSYTVILDVSGQNSSVLWASNAVDVTKAVVEAYNTVSGVAAPTTPKVAPKVTPRAASHK